VRNQGLRLLICGEGAEKARLLKEASGLSTVRFANLLQNSEYHQLLADADIMVVSLASGSGNSFFPSKLFSACSAGRAVVAICDPASELAVLVKENGCGVVVQHGDSRRLAEVFDYLADNQEKVRSMSRSAMALGDRYRWDDLLERFASDAGIG
jgi:colanic acid biosynthesis glycosyl transferase WcaI